MKRGTIRAWAGRGRPGCAAADRAGASPKVERMSGAAGHLRDRGARRGAGMPGATGNRVEAKAYKSVKVGRVEAKLGTIIGAELTIVGSPRRGKVPLRWCGVIRRRA